MSAVQRAREEYDIGLRGAESNAKGALSLFKRGNVAKGIWRAVNAERYMAQAHTAALVGGMAVDAEGRFYEISDLVGDAIGQSRNHVEVLGRGAAPKKKAKKRPRGNPSEDDHAETAEVMLRQADAALKKARKTTDRAQKALSLMVALRDSAVAYHAASDAAYDAVLDAAEVTAEQAREEMFQMVGESDPEPSVYAPWPRQDNGRRSKNPRGKTTTASARAILRRATRGT